MDKVWVSVDREVAKQASVASGQWGNLTVAVNSD